jgi:multiple sugar transport system ATP-binding protein
MLVLKDGQRVAVPKPLAPGLAGRRTAILGFRPEAIRKVAPERADLRGIVDVVEPTGPDTMIVVDIAGAKLTLRLGSRERVRPEEPIGLDLPEDALHLFDAGSGERL